MIPQVRDVADLFQEANSTAADPILLLPMMEERLRQDSTIGLIIINVSGLRPIEESCEKETYQKVVLDFSRRLERLQGKTIRKVDYLVHSELVGTSFAIFLSAGRSGSGRREIARTDVDSVAKRVRDELSKGLTEILGFYGLNTQKFSIAFEKEVHLHPNGKRIFKWNVRG